MDNDPLSNVPPEIRQRARNVFQSAADSMSQDTQMRSSTYFTHPPQSRGHSDRVWAHWEYSPDEWELFDRIDWQAARRAYWLPNIIGTIVFLLTVAIVTLLSQTVASDQIFLVTFIPFVALVLIFSLRTKSYTEAKKRYQARQSQGQAHTVTFSRDGVWEAGIHFSLHGILTNLCKVKLTFQPTVLHFHCEYVHLRQPNEYGVIRVLVPYGHEEEAVRLAQRFQIEVIEASKKPYNPPEPV